jgi:hypothetical protein
VHAPFWTVAFLYVGRAIDLAGVGHAIHQFVPAPARVCFGRCRLCCWRQARWNDLLWFTDPAHPADACTALLGGDEATVRAATNTIDSAPSRGLSRGGTDQNRRRGQQTAHPDRQFHRCSLTFANSVTTLALGAVIVTHIEATVRYGRSSPRRRISVA